MKNIIKEVRESKQMSQEELSIQAGITRTFLSGIESNKRNPSVFIGIKLAMALGKTVEEIFLINK